MVIRWILYLVAILGCIIFFAAYQGWVAWILLLTVALLPVFSLVLSIFILLPIKKELRTPGVVHIGEEATLELLLSSFLPLPPTKCRYRVTHCITGEELILAPGDPLPTAHCGQLICSSKGLYLYDLLGLFRFRQKLPTQTVLIRPKPIATEPPRDLERQLSHSWQPKYGGGFSEHHELRLYRPGDGLNQVHWKLSAKTGKLIIREAMVPKFGRILLTADLSGTPQQIDRKLGQLLWMGKHLLELGLFYELHALTGSGTLIHKVATETDLLSALDALLCCEPATTGTIRNQNNAASWQFHIGGDADEA